MSLKFLLPFSGLFRLFSTIFFLISMSCFSPSYSLIEPRGMMTDADQSTASTGNCIVKRFLTG
nr:hypothetical protein Iba_scaffold6887CG0020 [Ipomoea batatas]